MRTARIRDDSQNNYYHLYNRISGMPTDYEFGEKEKSKMLEILSHLLLLHDIEMIDFCLMDNHWHMIVETKSINKPLSKEEVYNRYLAYYGEKKVKTINWKSKKVLKNLTNRIHDMSKFIGVFQQRFTKWFNNSKIETTGTARRGSLWAGRYKSTLLQQGDALILGMNYVDMNPVRAKICEEPADFPFSSVGLTAQGKNPFFTNMIKHIKNWYGEQAQHWNEKQVYAKYYSELMRIVAAERGESSEQIFAIADDAKKHPRIKLPITKHTNFWTNGAVLGTKQFIQRIAEKIKTDSKSKTKPFGKAENSNGLVFYSYRNVRNS